MALLVAKRSARMASRTLEERVAALEAEVEQLKRERTASPSGEEPWWKRIVGVFQEDPEFEEAMRLGREYRESLRPSSDAVDDEQEP
jgi:hypothetical protein